MVSTLPALSNQQTVIIDIADYATHKTVIHSVRHTVFVYEQSIPAHLEIDHHDPRSIHVLAWWEGQAVGTGRLTPDGQIGRVAVAKLWRRQGIGRNIVQVLLDVANVRRLSGVRLAAQYHAVRFYEKLGFYQQGCVFQEFGIQHVMMHKTLIHP